MVPYRFPVVLQHWAGCPADEKDIVPEGVDASGVDSRDHPEEQLVEWSYWHLQYEIMVTILPHYHFSPEITPAGAFSAPSSSG